MKLNKFFALKTNFQSNPDEIRSGVPSGGGSNAATVKASPVFLDTYTKIQQQIDNLDKQLLKLFPDISDEEMTAKQVAARQELVALAEKNPALNFSQEDFAEALGLTPAQAIAQYYGIDLDDVYGEDRLKIGGDGLSLTANVATRVRDYAKDNPSRSVFSSFDFAPPDQVTASDVEVETDFALPSATDLQTRLDAFVPRDRQMPNVSLSTPAFTVADKLGTTMFDAINFPERTINRGVPVVTKGIDAQGNPTTGITMGNAAASPSGPTIGELDISAILPSTGMGINADGSGTTTVGTQGTTGNIVASSADTLNMVDPGVTANPMSSLPANPISAIDPNVLGTQGNTVTAGPITTVTPPTPTPTPTPAKTQAQIIQDLFNSSPTKDVAAIRIGDYAASVGGITAQQIADAVQPIIGVGKPDFGIAAFDAGTGGDEVLKAVADGGYGGGFITATAEDISAAQPMYNTLAARQEQLRTGFGDDKAVGDADYTPQEAAYRMLDFAKRNDMTLEQAAQSFGLTEAQARDRLGSDDLNIDLAQFGFEDKDKVGFADGGEVEDSRSKAVGSRLMAHAGIGSMQGKSMSSDMAGTLDRIMARRK